MPTIYFIKIMCLITSFFNICAIIFNKERGTTLLKRKCKITFIAHGETVHSQENRISDSEKYPPLTANGEEEIARVCEYIKKRGVKSDKIYTSPATRCIQSARTICKIFKQEFEVLDELHTRKCGTLNGKTYETIAKSYSHDTVSIADINVEGGESLEDFNKRVVKVVREIVEKNIGSRIIIVTYPNVIQAAVAHILSIAPENQPKVLIKTGSLTQISCFEDWSSLIYSGYVPL